MVFKCFRMVVWGLLWVGSVAWAQALQVGNVPVSFEPPSGFVPVPQAIIDIKWPGSRAPRFVVGNAAATTTVAYDLKPHRIPQDKMEEIQKVFTPLMERMVPGIRWVKNELIEHAGQQWLFMEMTSHAVDTDIHNILLVTGIADQMLVFNFNSTREEFPRLEQALRESIRSIRVLR
jgi:hypothetical protein